MKNTLSEGMLTLNSESHEMYDQFLPDSEDTRATGQLYVTQVRETCRGQRRGCRVVIIVALVTSLIINVVLTSLVFYYTYLMFPSNANNKSENWPSLSEESARETTADQKQLCIPCQGVTRHGGVPGHPGICCHHSHDSALLLIKLLLNQKNEKSIPLLYGQYRISSISGETISLKSYQEKVPRSFLIPGSSNRIRVTVSGYYSVYGSMCFSGREFRGDSIPLDVRLEQVRGDSKQTLIRRAATVHWHPSSFVNVHFMESVWLNKTTDLFLFISHPNVLYSFPECNILTLFKTK